jgi:hypothetical protein
MSANMLGQLGVALQELNWDANDEIRVKIGGVAALMNTKGAIVGYKTHRDYGETSIYSKVK